MSTPSRSLSQTRALAAQPIRNKLTAPHVQALEQDTHHSAQPEPGALGQVIRDLSISEPATLLRAAAIDQAVDALTADAKAQSQRRAAALDIPARLTKHLHSEATAARNPRAFQCRPRPSASAETALSRLPAGGTLACPVPAGRVCYDRPDLRPPDSPPGGSHVRGLFFLSRHAQRTFTWTCPACHRTIIDNGSWTDMPGREAGHEPDCPAPDRRNRRVGGTPSHQE